MLTFSPIESPVLLSLFFLLVGYALLREATGNVSPNSKPLQKDDPTKGDGGGGGQPWWGFNKKTAIACVAVLVVAVVLGSLGGGGGDGTTTTESGNLLVGTLTSVGQLCLLGLTGLTSLFATVPPPSPAPLPSPTLSQLLENPEIFESLTERLTRTLREGMPSHSESNKFRGWTKLALETLRDGTTKTPPGWLAFHIALLADLAPLLEGHLSGKDQVTLLANLNLEESAFRFHRLTHYALNLDDITSLTARMAEVFKQAIESGSYRWNESLGMSQPELKTYFNRVLSNQVSDGGLKRIILNDPRIYSGVNDGSLLEVAHEKIEQVLPFR